MAGFDFATMWAASLADPAAGLNGQPYAGEAAFIAQAAQAVDAAREERRHKLQDEIEDWEEARRRHRAQQWQAPPATATLAAELALPRSSPAYRILGLAGWNHNVLLAGPRKTGKTQLLVNLNAALSLSSHDPARPGGQPPWVPGPFLGHYTGCFMSGNAAYLNAEMDADDWRDTFRALPAKSYNASRIFPLHCRGIPMPVITSEAARAWFVSWLRGNRVEVLTIDTWGAFCAANGVRDLNDDGAVRVITDGLDRIKAEAGVAFLVIPIHTPHQTGERHLERFKGAGAVGDWADTLWTYLEGPGGLRYLGAAGRARIDMAETALAYDPATGLLGWSSGNRAQHERQSMRDRITDAVRDHDGILRSPLVAKAGGHAATAKALIELMVEEGALVTEERGRSILHHLPPRHPAADPGAP
jgi:hypothetical protein